MRGTQVEPVPIMAI